MLSVLHGPPGPCRTCGGKGWVPSYQGDPNGDLCLSCADPFTLSLLEKPLVLDRQMPQRNMRKGWVKGNPVVNPDALCITARRFSQTRSRRVAYVHNWRARQVRTEP